MHTRSQSKAESGGTVFMNARGVASVDKGNAIYFHFSSERRRGENFSSFHHNFGIIKIYAPTSTLVT